MVSSKKNKNKTKPFLKLVVNTKKRLGKTRVKYNFPKTRVKYNFRRGRKGNKGQAGGFAFPLFKFFS